MTKARFDVGATLALLGALLCWSSVPLFLKYLTGYVPDGWTTNAVRYPVAALLYLPWLVGVIRDPSRRRLLVIGLLPAVPNLIGQSCWAWAPYYIDPGLMAFVVRVSAIWTIVLAILLFADERPLLQSKRFWCGVVLGVAGFLGVAFGSEAIHARATVVGILITLCSSICLALYMIAVRITVGGRHPMSAFAVVSAYTAIGCLLLAPLGEPSSVVSMPTGALAVLLISALFGIAMAHGMYYISVKSLGAAIPTATVTLSPFLTAAASGVLFAERFGPLQWAGGVVLVAGIGLVLWSQEHVHHHRLIASQEAIQGDVEHPIAAD